jgi:hypothetical protein
MVKVLSMPRPDENISGSWRQATAFQSIRVVKKRLRRRATWPGESACG